MATNKSGSTKKKLAPGKKQQKIKPLMQDFHFTKTTDTPSVK
jgi:hypothetical protein